MNTYRARALFYVPHHKVLFDFSWLPGVIEMSFNPEGKEPSRFQFDMDLPQSGGSEDFMKPGEAMMVGNTMSGDGDEDSSQFSMSPREQHDQETDLCLRMFENWTQSRQTEFVEQLIARMSFHQHEHIYSILMPMLQRDFITVLPSEFTTITAYHITL